MVNPNWGELEPPGPGMVWVACEACGRPNQEAAHWHDGSRDYRDPPYQLCAECLRLLWRL
jgi:hypothetical protein